MDITEFYNGYLTAMLWSTSGGPDYSRAPEGYTIFKMAERDGWYWTAQRNPRQRSAKAEAGLFAAGDYCPSRELAVRACWADANDSPPEIESLKNYMLSEEASKASMADCASFAQANKADLVEYAERRRFDPSQGTVWAYAGHDFWLTRVGHGVGYWDRGLGALGERLTDAAQAYPHIDPYIGDDNLVYV